MSRLKIVSLHCFGSNPHKHVTQKWHFVHCAEACAGLAEWVYPAGPNLLEPQVVRNLLKNDMGCTDEEVEAFGFEEPRCWFRFTDNCYEGLEDSMDYLAGVCRRHGADDATPHPRAPGAGHGKITIPTTIFGSRHDPMLANARQMAADLFERCELAIADETRPFANHALPEKAECYERIVSFVKARL